MAYPQYIIPAADYFIYADQLDHPNLMFNDQVFAYSTDVDTTESVLQDGGGNYTFLTAAEKLSIVSDNAGDTLGGLGMNIIRVIGLDANYNIQSEIVSMAGLTPVTTTKSYLRLFNALAIVSGTNDPINDANLGTITISGATTTTWQGQIQPHEGRTHGSNYTIPAGYNAYITGIISTIGAGKSATINLKFRTGPTNNFAFTSVFKFEVYQNAFCCEPRDLIALPAGHDLLITAKTALPSAVSVGCKIGLHLIKNDYKPGHDPRN